MPPMPPLNACGAPCRESPVPMFARTGECGQPAPPVNPQRTNVARGAGFFHHEWPGGTAPARPHPPQRRYSVKR